MSAPKSFHLGPEIHRYLVAHGTPQDPVLRDLAEETARLGPIAMMQIAPEQGAFMTLLARAIGARRAVEVGTFTGYSALCIARGDTRELPGFDEKLYARHSGFEERPLADLLAEYRAVREATLAFFAGLPGEAWSRCGTVNDYTATVRGLAFHIAGHERRHLRALRDKYLNALSSGENT